MSSSQACVVERSHASLADVLERTLATGVAVRGDVVLSIAGVDLVVLDLRLVLAAAATLASERELTATPIGAARG